MNHELLRRIQTELSLHAWPIYPLVENHDIVGCACGKACYNAKLWRDHIVNDVIPKCLEDAPS